MTEREITDADLDSASRGLRMKRLLASELEALIEFHDAVDAVASDHIAAAARRELILRGVQHADA